MTKEETQQVRLAAKALLHRLREESPKVLVQDWFKDVRSKSRVRSAVESILDKHLPKSYDRIVFTEKCNNVFDLMLNYASQGIKMGGVRWRPSPLATTELRPFVRADVSVDLKWAEARAFENTASSIWRGSQTGDSR